MSIRAIRHASGKRVFIGANPQGNQPKSEFTRKIAARLSIGETSACEVLTQGKTRKGWKVEEMQRERLPMIITYKLTEAGRVYADYHQDSAFGAFLRLCESGEASDISERLLALGHTKHCRQRVLIDAAKAKEKGFLTMQKLNNRVR